MVNIVVGLVAICLAIWGLVTYWWYTVDVIVAIFPVALLFLGIIAVMAGIKNTGLKATVIPSKSRQTPAEPTGKKKDE
jgi:hypothetical protein